MSTDLTIPTGQEIESWSPRDTFQLEAALALANAELGPKLRELNDDHLRRWVGEGKTQTWIAEEVGLTQQAISLRCQRLGLVSKSNRGRPAGITSTCNSDPVPGKTVHTPDDYWDDEQRDPTEKEAYSIRKQKEEYGYESAVELAANWGVSYDSCFAEEVDGEVVEDTPPPSPRAPRTDVVAVVSSALLRAGEAASSAERVSKTHLTKRPDECALWARELSEYVSQLQRLLTLLEEISND